MALEARFTKDEIKQDAFDLGGDRALGLDGFPIVFSQHFWDLLEDDFFIFCNEFHDNGALTGELGASFIALIPNKDGAMSFRSRLTTKSLGKRFMVSLKLW